MEKIVLAPADFPSDLSADIVRAVQQAIAELTDPAVSKSRDLVTRNLATRDSYVAILNKDLDLWKEVVSTIGGLGAVVPNLVAIAGGLVLLLYRMRRYRIRLTGLQGALLLMLKGSGESGYSEKELFDSLGISSIDHENVREALKFLEAAPAENREPKQLVIHKEGIWVACDV